MLCRAVDRAETADDVAAATQLLVGCSQAQRESWRWKP